MEEPRDFVVSRRPFRMTSSGQQNGIDSLKSRGYRGSLSKHIVSSDDLSLRLHEGTFMAKFGLRMYISDHFIRIALNRLPVDSWMRSTTYVLLGYICVWKVWCMSFRRFLCCGKYRVILNIAKTGIDCTCNYCIDWPLHKSILHYSMQNTPVFKSLCTWTDASALFSISSLAQSGCGTS